jgi:hypothetical protein
LLLVLSLAATAVTVGGVAAPGASAISCNQKLFDGGGYIFDSFAEANTPPALFDYFGNLSEGGSNGPADTPPGPVKTNDAYDEWGDVYLFSPGADIENPSVDNKYLGAEDGCLEASHEIAFPVKSMFGLEVQHRLYVDPSSSSRGARILNTLHNPSGAPITVTVVEGDPDAIGNLGSDSGTTAHQTSDGSGVFSPNAVWGVTSDSPSLSPGELDSDAALAHVWDGVGGAIRASEVVLGKPEADDLYYVWKSVTVPAGGTASLISYEIESAVAGREAGAEAALAASQAQAREGQSLASLYSGMSAVEIGGTLNWPRPVPAAGIAPVKKPNAANKVTLTSTSTEASGLAQCPLTYAWATSDGATGSGPVLKHLFKPGKRSATLTVSNSCGGTATATASFKVAKPFKFGKVKANAKKGTATIKVNALGAGKLTLSGKGLKAQKKSLKKAGKVTLTVKPTGKTQGKLVKSGQAKVKATVSFKPVGGKPLKQKKSVVLKLAG